MALKRDPSLVPAYFNRGMTYLELNQHSQALADFDKAVELGAKGPLVDAGRGMALEGMGRFKEADTAFELALARADTLPGARRLRLLWTYGFAVSGRLPEKARQVFEAILHTTPRHPEALYGCAMLAVGQGCLTEALRYFDLALEGTPEFDEARRYRAVILARTGLWQRASEDVNRCLQRDSGDGSTLYSAACVASLASRQLSDPRAAQQAIEFLERAQACGMDITKAGTDPDLKPIRELPSFKRLLDRSGPRLSAHLSMEQRHIAP